VAAAVAVRACRTSWPRVCGCAAVARVRVDRRCRAFVDARGDILPRLHSSPRSVPVGLDRGLVAACVSMAMAVAMFVSIVVAVLMWMSSPCMWIAVG
jgi:uncharacterized protein (DUF2062 family)